VTTVQVILSGEWRMTLHDTFDYPLVLQFGAERSFERAHWVLPSYHVPIPAYKLSEMRVQDGALEVLVDGPEGFRSGPHSVTWVRAFYPSGKDCSLLSVDAHAGVLKGVSITTVEGSLVVEDFVQRRNPPAD
jgi:hypothetical protein